MKAHLFFILIVFLLCSHNASAQDSADIHLFEELSQLNLSDSFAEVESKRFRDSTEKVFWESISVLNTLTGKKNFKLMYQKYKNRDFSPEIEIEYDEAADTLMKISIFIKNDKYSTNIIYKYKYLRKFKKLQIEKIIVTFMDASWTPPFTGNDATYAAELEKVINTIYERFRPGLNSKYSNGYPENYWRLEQTKNFTLSGRIKYRKQFIKLLQSNCNDCGRL